jgi:cell division protein ZapA
MRRDPLLDELPGEHVKRSVTVVVAGLKFQLKTEADEAYVAALARLVNERVDEAKLSARTAPTHQIALLAALNLADELLRTRREAKAFKAKVREKSRTLLGVLEPDGEAR